MSQSAYPGDSYKEAVLRIEKALALDEQTLKEIGKLSEESFRVWLNDVAERIADKLGYAVGFVRAYIEDILSIASNFSASFRDGFRRGYHQSRIIKKRN